MTDFTTKIAKPGLRVSVASTQPTRVALSNSTVARINDNRPNVIQQARPTPVEVTVATTQVSVGGAMGMQGPPGESDGATITATASVPMHGDRVAAVRNGWAYHPEPTDPTHGDEVVGVTTHSASAGAPIVIRTAGKARAAEWSFQPGPVFVGPAGTLTQTPGPGWLGQIGRATDTDELIVDPEPTIYRSV